MRTEQEICASWKTNDDILVSITCIAYNHEKYIEEAIKGFLIQETDFPFEIIIHDDASTDATQDIIRHYQKLYPNLIRAILQTENHWMGKGINATATIVWPSAKGKYIAWCEGDDYWTDSQKLQKQVDFLEGNPKYGSCFHQYLEYFENKKKFAEVPRPFDLKLYSAKDNYMEIETDDYFKGWYTQLVTAVIRKDILEQIKFAEFNLFRDNHIAYFLLSQKPAACFNSCWAIYRKHSEGMHSGVNHLKNFTEHYFIYEELLLFTDDIRFEYLCNNMVNELLKKYPLIELKEFFINIQIKKIKNIIFYHYPKSQKLLLFKVLPFEQKYFVLKEFLKRIHAKI